MSPSDIHSATISVNYLIGAITGGGVFNLSLIAGWEKWRAWRKGKQEGTMEQKMKDLEEKNKEDREVIRGFKETLENISREVSGLAVRMAAFTGVANGIDYRRKGES